MCIAHNIFTLELGPFFDEKKSKKSKTWKWSDFHSFAKIENKE
jgi:hypothetical protein